ncbi:lyase family protein [Neobacillus jeddahensis]
MENSIDVVASKDYVLEAPSAMNILMSNLSRFSHDLYIWSTNEFGVGICK